jgi:Glycosyltransferase
MRVLVANNMAPFIRGGAEELADELVRQLRARGHDAELLRLPFAHEPAEGIPAQMLLARRLVLENVDRLIALKFPAYLIPHPSTSIWLLHQFRQAYDLFDAGQSNLREDATGLEVRDIVRRADDEALARPRVFTNSSVTQDRLKRYNGLPSEVLLPPLNDPERFEDLGDEGYVFAGGRINDHKRQSLLIEAMASTPPQTRLVIAGPADSAADADRLRSRIAELGLESRVTLDVRFLPRDVYADYVNRSSAVAYLPFDEDSLGYVTMEAAQAGKPVITTTDSGGLLQLVQHGKTGWVVPPDPAELASALRSVATDEPARKTRGAAIRKRWLSFDANWDRTIERLLA